MSKINSIKIDKYFELSEFECPCCHRVIIHSDLLKRLVALRHVILEPIFINSGYRCKQYNTQIDGEPNSYHLLGMAADITVRNTSMHDLALQAEAVGFMGIIKYYNFLHLDVRKYPFHEER